MNYFAVKVGDEWVRFTMSPKEKFIKILDSYGAEYVASNTSTGLGLRKYKKFKDKDLIQNYKNYPIYIIVGKDNTFYPCYCEPVVFETIFDGLGIEYYKFKDTKDNEYKNKIKELSGRA